MVCNIENANSAYREKLGIDDGASISAAMLAQDQKKVLAMEAKLFGQGPYGPVFGDDILPKSPDEMSVPELQNTPYMIGRCSGEGDALLTGTIPIFLKAGLHSGFSKEVFEMVLCGCFERMCPDALKNPSEWIENIMDVYGPTCTDDEYFYSEIFCKWWGDLFLGMGPVVTADQYSEAKNEMFMYEMTHRSLHSHDLNYSGKLKLKPRWSGCDHCDDTCKCLLCSEAHLKSKGYLELCFSIYVRCAICRREIHARRC